MTPEYNQMYQVTMNVLKDIKSNMKSILLELEKYKLDNKINLLSKKEVEQIFDIKSRTISCWSEKKILVPLNIGGKVYYDMKDIMATIQKAKEQGNPKKKE